MNAGARLTFSFLFILGPLLSLLWPWQPQPYTDTLSTLFSLLQAEYRLCNGSDKECTSPTTRVSKKDALKVGMAQGEDGGNTHTLYISSSQPS